MADLSCRLLAHWVCRRAVHIALADASLAELLLQILVCLWRLGKYYKSRCVHVEAVNGIARSLRHSFGLSVMQPNGGQTCFNRQHSGRFACHDEPFIFINNLGLPLFWRLSRVRINVEALQHMR